MTTPVLRIVIGTAGSGKSTIAQHLAREHVAAYLDKDAMSARFVEAALTAAGYDPGDRESNAFYLEHILPLEYDSLLDVAGVNLRLGLAVVIDAPFSPYLSDPDFITAAQKRFHWPPVDVEVIRVHVSPMTLQRRLRQRGLERDHWKLAHWDQYWAQHGGQSCTWTGVRLTEFDNDAFTDHKPVSRRLEGAGQPATSSESREPASGEECISDVNKRNRILGCG